VFESTIRRSRTRGRLKCPKCGKMARRSFRAGRDSSSKAPVLLTDYKRKGEKPDTGEKDREVEKVGPRRSRSPRSRSRNPEGFPARQVKAHDTLRAALVQAAAKLGAPTPTFSSSAPKIRPTATCDEFGLALAKTLKAKPRDVAQRSSAHSTCLRVSSAGRDCGPRLHQFLPCENRSSQCSLRSIAAAAKYGRGDVGRAGPPTSIRLRPIPRGPCTSGHGRQGRW